MNDEDFYACINRKKHGNNGIALCKIIVDDKKGCWKWNLLCTPVKVHNMDTDQLVFGDKNGMVKKAEIDNLMTGLHELAQKLDALAAVLFILIDVKGESGTRQQQPHYLCYDPFFDSGWVWKHNIISQHNC